MQERIFGYKWKPRWPFGKQEPIMAWMRRIRSPSLIDFFLFSPWYRSTWTWVFRLVLGRGGSGIGSRHIHGNSLTWRCQSRLEKVTCAWLIRASAYIHSEEEKHHGSPVSGPSSSSLTQPSADAPSTRGAALRFMPPLTQKMKERETAGKCCFDSSTVAVETNRHLSTEKACHITSWNASEVSPPSNCRQCHH